MEILKRFASTNFWILLLNLLLIIFCFYEWTQITSLRHQNNFINEKTIVLSTIIYEDLSIEEEIINDLKTFEKTFDNEAEEVIKLRNNYATKNNNFIEGIEKKTNEEIKKIDENFENFHSFYKLLKDYTDEYFKNDCDDNNNDNNNEKKIKESEEDFLKQIDELNKEKEIKEKKEKIVKNFLQVFNDFTSEIEEIEQKENGTIQILKKITIEKNIQDKNNQIINKTNKNKYMGFGNWYGDFQFIEEPPINRTLLRLKEQSFISSKLTEKDDSILVLISCEVSQYQLWQTKTSFLALRKAGQKNILRILNTPSQKNLEKNSEFGKYIGVKSLYIDNVFEDYPIDGEIREKYSFDEIPTFICPSYALIEETQDYYPPRNRIGGLIDFFEYIDNLKLRNLANPYENITSIALIDPDMIVTKKFSYSPDRFHPIGQPSGYMNMRKYTKMVYKYTNSTPEFAQDSFTPLVIHIDDLRSIMSDWMNITEKLREEKDREVIEPKNWICEMYGYVLSSAIHNLTHHSPDNFSASPPADHLSEESEPPDVYHYCYELKYGDYVFNKQHYYSSPPFPRPLPSPPSNATITSKRFLKIMSDLLTEVYGRNDTINKKLPWIPGLFNFN